MTQVNNPFLVNKYVSPGYFCDREEETSGIMEALLNGRNITLYALRRMGKTGLIHHVAYKMRRKHKWLFLYTDIYSTENESDLVETLTNAILQQLGSNKNLLEQVQEAFSGLRPMISFDPISGAPKVKFDIHSEPEIMQSLEQIFAFVESFGKPVYWAWDEFQQISTYPNAGKMIRKIRTLVQQSKNTQFVFSGSHRGMLMSIFEDSNSAFYKSTQLMHLTEIADGKYTTFICAKFAKASKECSPENAAYILERCLSHTWFVQNLCNRLYQDADILTQTGIDRKLRRILQEQELGYYRYRNILSSGQWSLLKAIGRAEKVTQISSQEFASRYGLSSSASTLRALQALMRDELVVEEWKDDKRYYRLHDVYLMRWLQWKYD